MGPATLLDITGPTGRTHRPNKGILWLIVNQKITRKVKNTFQTLLHHTAKTQ